MTPAELHWPRDIVFKVLKIIADNGTQSPQIQYGQLRDIFVRESFSEEQLSVVLKRLVALALIYVINGPIESLNMYYIAAEGLQTVRNHRVCQCKLCQFS